ncbi:uncharacterized protein PGTG_13967 [Puccinia graminis f. sp. tritici CRL 75-36-700-3]|uniref:Uncharacterized protein n=1 Tax=Puccinia graminis f. sp. tritici (strain CRL 75-36-700-3 / race SCCL) TaxID=418459 RepID=E3KTH1_PUCGT|nr:uncharacterized protein PGTG_13967 [Puccinia graminis f. sp. tritici CRL 75-36-700-3]EFP87596.2 hypothetical protein PGTG_13967 [Puccinia graminis f. sp. tritici CRL 75-36-700-3]
MLTWLFCLLLIEKCFAMHCPQRSPLRGPRDDHHIITIDTLSPDSLDPIQKDSCIGASTNTEASDDPENPSVHLAYSSNHQGQENPSTSIAMDNHPAEIEKMTRSRNSRTSSLQDPISLSPIPNVELIPNESEQIANQCARKSTSRDRISISQDRKSVNSDWKPFNQNRKTISQKLKRALIATEDFILNASKPGYKRGIRAQPVLNQIPYLSILLRK